MVRQMNAKSDRTVSARAANHLIRLKKAQGKRVMVDFDAASLAALQSLIAKGYSKTQRGAVLRAVIEASNRSFETHCPGEKS